MTTYTPEPGTVAYRVLAHLETLPKGAEVMTSALAEALGLEGRNVAPCLETALAKGLVFRRQRDTHVRSPFWWSLTDYSAIPKAERPVLEIPNTPPKGANRVRQVLKAEGASPDATDSEARSKVMAAEGSGSPTARGDNVAPASGAAPAFLQRRGPDTGAQVDGCRAPESHAGACSGRAQQDQTSLPASPKGIRIALWSDGTLQIERAGAAPLILSRPETRALVQYLDAIARDCVCSEGGAR